MKAKVTSVLAGELGVRFGNSRCLEGSQAELPTFKREGFENGSETLST